MLPVAAVPPDQKRMWHLCRGNGICVQLNLWLWRGVYLLPAPPPSPAIASSRGGQARWWNLPSRPLSALLFPNLSVRLCFLTLPHWPCLCLAINYRKHPLWNLSKYCRRINIQFIKNYIAGLQHYQCFDEFCCRWQLLFCDDCCWAWFDLFFFFFLWEECWRGKRRRQRADSCMDEERVISPCSSFSTTLNASFVGFVANGLSLWSVAIKGSFFLSADGALACGLILDPLHRRTHI